MASPLKHKLKFSKRVFQAFESPCTRETKLAPKLSRSKKGTVQREKNLSERGRGSSFVVRMVDSQLNSPGLILAAAVSNENLPF